MTPEIPPPQTRRMLHLTLHGLVAVHAARAAHTALGAVPGIVSASVSMAGADVEVEGPFDGEAFAAAVQRALEPIGMALESVTTVQTRSLPMA